MSINELNAMALEAAQDLTGKPAADEHTQDVAFHLFCAAMAEEFASRGCAA